MRRKLSFDPAWLILTSVIATLVVLKFTHDEHLHNLIACVMLAAVALLFFVSLVKRLREDKTY